MKRFCYLFVTLILVGCIDSKPSSNTELSKINPETYWGESPWPEIRKERINKLLPSALKNANVEVTNVARFCGEDTVSVHRRSVGPGSEKVQPPTAMSVLSAGCSRLSCTKS